MVGEQQRLFKTKKIIMKKECECTDECLGYLTKECKRIEEPKQETLEEAAYRLSAEKFEPKHIAFMLGVIEGAKWQQERSYSEEDLRIAFEAGHKKGFSGYPNTENWKELPLKEWFEKFKKK